MTNPPPFPGPPPLPEPPGRPLVPPLPEPSARPGPVPYTTTGPEEPRLRVHGEAALEVEPELATLTVTVAARGKDRRSALAELTRRNSAALDLLKSHGEALDKLDTGSFTVTPELSERRAEKVRAYRGSVRIHATFTDFSVLGELTTRLADLELTRVQGPWWSLRPDSPAHRRAREEAVRSAVQRAREYAKALGAELRALLELSDTGTEPGGPPSPFPGATLAGARAYAAESADHAPPLELEPARQTVFAQVTAHFTMTRPELS